MSYQERIDNLFASETWSSVYTAFTNVSLKAYDFDTIRESLLAYVQKTYPEKFNDFIASSEFIAILDLVAYLGHSLAFRNDMNTRENFMDTAERRISILRMAQTLGYIKTRPINARGMMKITSISTTEDVADNEGNSLAGTVVNWNDTNDVDWYEKFVTILNASFNKNTKIQDPSASLTVGNIENYLYEVNENQTSKSLAYAFSTNLAGANRRLEAVRTVIENKKIIEGEPIQAKNFTILNRNDNLGPASDRTGFFVTAKSGQLKSQLFSYLTKISNRTELIDDVNISNSDVWIQKFDTQAGTYLSSVTKVDNDTRETAIYNSLRTGSGDMASVHTNTDNSIEIRYPDGIFGNAAFGDYRVWYRTCDNENYTVNSGDIENANISIPYIGADERAYRLVLTLASTRDFAENFTAETFTSVRRIAQKAYYSQDRMVNAQDYNIYPLTLGNNVIQKIKSVNTSFAGNSRYFEMDDVTGHHSDLSITGTDGSIYIEDEGGSQPDYTGVGNIPPVFPNWTDSIQIALSFNRDHGNASDFVRNEVVKAISHPALLTQYFYQYKDDASVNIAVAPADGAYTKSPLNNLQIETTNPLDVETGDYIRIKGQSDTIYHARVIRVGSGDPSELILDKVITETGTIELITRDMRKKFTDAEILAIKTAKIDDANVESFTLFYDLVSGTTTKWEWKIWDGTTDITGKIQVFLKYDPGLRTSEAQYTAHVKGKRIVFESLDQVKFYYGNAELIVDNETNLAERDQLLINYYNPSDATPSSSSTIGSDDITIGYAPVNTYADDGTGGATFKAKFKYTGAEDTLEFVENNPAQIGSPTYKHFLVSPDGITYELAASTITAPASPDNIIGATPEYELEFAVPDISQFVATTTEVSLNNTVADSTEINISPDQMPVVTETGAANVASAEASYSTVSFENLSNTYGFKGKASASYFSSAPTTGNFMWVDGSDLPTGETYTTATPGMTGVQTDFISLFDSNLNQWKFTYPIQSWGVIESADNVQNDVRFKQVAFSEISFSSNETVTQSTLILRDSNGVILDKDHAELTSTAGTGGITNYVIYFWTIDPGEGSQIDVLSGDGSSTTSLGTFTVKVVANVNLISSVTSVTTSYETKSAYVHDDFMTRFGYIDPSKVKLLPFDVNDNPYGILDIFRPTGNTSKIVIEEYQDSVTYYERISTRATAGANIGGANYMPSDTKPQYTLWFNTDSDANGQKWYLYTDGIWRALTAAEFSQPDPSDPTCIYFGPTKYKVVEGRSFVEDEFMSFRWDHYTDLDKRIDPSTSNIVDVYVLTSDYVRQVNKWIASKFVNPTPTAPNNFELKSLMGSIEPKAAIADHISYIPVKFKYLFGAFAKPENQACFKVVKKAGTSYTESEIKTAVSAKVNEYFDLNNWDFGDTFYFSELASYLHQQLGEYIASVVITPKFSTSGFTDLLSITSEPNEIFLSVTTSSDVKIISAISQTELQGEEVTNYV
tara:strand:+ start:12516 stop:16928 length:4413 start_codon:yes stop_codon:yes gene_type:complete